MPDLLNQERYRYPEHIFQLECGACGFIFLHTASDYERPAARKTVQATINMGMIACPKCTSTKIKIK